MDAANSRRGFLQQTAALTVAANLAPPSPSKADDPKAMPIIDTHQHLKGLRRVLHGADTPPGHCLSGRFIDDIRLLGKNGLSFDLCMRLAELGDAAKLIDACPETSFILDHCGTTNVRAKDLRAGRPNLAGLRGERMW
jgi:predicted TIM-barrel fold metal-dependent hydrolase